MIKKDAYTQDWHDTAKPLCRYAVRDNYLCGDECYCEMSDHLGTFTTMTEVRKFAKQVTPHGWLSVSATITERHKYSDLKFIIHDVRTRAIKSDDVEHGRVVKLNHELKML